MNNIKLIPADDKQMFITDIQKVFKEGYEAVYGTCEGEIIPVEDIEESFSKANAQCYFALINDEIAGGVVVIIDKNTQKNNLDLLYVKSDYQSKGVGLKIWQEIENIYPKTKVWETHTPYFDKRNIHFYVNKCGFHIVEFFNPKHKICNIKENSVGAIDEESLQYFFRFEKHNFQIVC